MRTWRRYNICFSILVSSRVTGLFILGGLFTSSRALSQPVAHDPVAAESLFRQGFAERERGDWPAACAKFQKANELDPTVSTECKIAECREHEGKLATAWYDYQTARKMNHDAQQSERRRAALEKYISDALKALEPRVPQLHIKITPSSDKLQEFRLLRDGQLISNSVIGEYLPVDPGRHVIAAQALGYSESRVDVFIAEGAKADVTLTLVAEQSTAPPPSNHSDLAVVILSEQSDSETNQRQTNAANRSPVTDPDSRKIATGDTGPRSSPWGQRQSALAIGGAGLLAFGFAGYYGIRTLVLVGQMSDHKKPDGTYDSGVYAPRNGAIRSQTTGLVLGGIGTAMTGLGIALYLSAPSRNAPSMSAVTPVLRLAFTPTGVSAMGEW